jgi:hypothetical protein
MEFAGLGNATAIGKYLHEVDAAFLEQVLF